jgi:hypothetical protein
VRFSFFPLPESAFEPLFLFRDWTGFPLFHLREAFDSADRGVNHNCDDINQRVVFTAINSRVWEK